MVKIKNNETYFHSTRNWTQTFYFVIQRSDDQYTYYCSLPLLPTQQDLPILPPLQLNDGCIILTLFGVTYPSLETIKPQYDR